GYLRGSSAVGLYRSQDGTDGLIVCNVTGVETEEDLLYVGYWIPLNAEGEQDLSKSIMPVVSDSSQFSVPPRPVRIATTPIIPGAPALVLSSAYGTTLAIGSGLGLVQTVEENNGRIELTTVHDASDVG